MSIEAIVAIVGLFFTTSGFIIGILIKISTSNRGAHTIIHEKINGIKDELTRDINDVEIKVAKLETKIFNGGKKNE